MDPHSTPPSSAHSFEEFRLDRRRRCRFARTVSCTAKRDVRNEVACHLGGGNVDSAVPAFGRLSIPNASVYLEVFGNAN